MKKAPLLTALVALTFILTACGASPSGSDPAGSGSSGSGFRSGGTRTLSPEAKLALGTIKLEGTKQAVDAKTAAKLIPLWQLMVQLNSSSSSAPQEVTAVLDQIKLTMSPDQLSTINGMSITQADVFAEFQQQAQANGSGTSSGTGASGFAGGNNRRNGGGFVFGGGPGGGFGGGGFGGGFGGGGARTNNGTGSGSITQETAAQQAQAAQARQNAISDLLINQLIRLLQTQLNC
jgi:hypothetical protein